MQVYLFGIFLGVFLGFHGSQMCSARSELGDGECKGVKRCG